MPQRPSLGDYVTVRAATGGATVIRPPPEVVHVDYPLDADVRWAEGQRVRVARIIVGLVAEERADVARHRVGGTRPECVTPAAQGPLILLARLLGLAV